jgi:hypothetical protein
VLQERSDVPEEWKELGTIFEIPAGTVVDKLVEFTRKQTYESGQLGSEEGSMINAVLLSWTDICRASWRKRARGLSQRPRYKSLSGS